MLGPPGADGTDSYVLGEINVSSVFPIPDEAWRSAMSMMEIRLLLAEALGKHILIVFDSCFAGTIFLAREGNAAPRELTPDVVARLMEKPSRDIITAGRANERVPAHPIPKLFLAALNGAADPYQRGVVTAAEINIYLRSQLLNLPGVNLTPQQGRLLDPNFAEGEFLFRVPNIGYSVDSAAQAWAAVKDSTSIAMLEQFRMLYPRSVQAPFAAARIEELKQLQTAVVKPPVAPAVPKNEDGSLIPLANAYVNVGRYQEAEPLYLRALAIRERVFGPDHMDVASVINYLARLQFLMGRTTESIDSSRQAVRVVVNRLTRDAGSGSAPDIASLRDYFDQNIAIMERAQRERILGQEAGSEAFVSAQWANQSAAATTLAQMAARFSAGDRPLAALVRQQQDAASELRILDRSLPAELTKPENQRDPQREATMRRRATELSARVGQLNKDVATRFPEYASLVSPKPLAVQRVQQLLGADEALAFFLSREKESHVFAVTRESFEWKTIPVGAEAMAAKVAAVRRGVDVDVLLDSIDAGKPVLFDLGVAYDLYQTLLGPGDPVIKNKPHLLVVPTGALTALPFYVLVTERPAMAVPRHEDMPIIARQPG
jgi:hypothetical protein